MLTFRCGPTRTRCSNSQPVGRGTPGRFSERVLGVRARGRVYLVQPGHESGARHLGCWAQMRRKLVEAVANNPAKASEALAYIRTPYAVEEEIADGKLMRDTVVSLRQARAGTILRTFGEWLEVEGRRALLKSPFGQAVSYAQNQWQTLGRYLNDARFAIDNNVAERAVRPLAMGRKHWLFVGGDGNLHSAAALMSLCASAKRHALNPQVRPLLGRASASDNGRL